LTLLIQYGQRLDFVDGRTIAKLIERQQSDIIKILLDNGVSSQLLDDYEIPTKYYDICEEFATMGFDRQKVSYLLGGKVF
jgi:hypothetical protein